MRNSLPVIWVLVDKRGDILEEDSLTSTSLENGAGVPRETFWMTRSAARFQLDEIKNDMTEEAWNTWKFRTERYTRDGAESNPICEICKKVSVNNYRGRRTNKCTKCRQKERRT